MDTRHRIPIAAAATIALWAALGCSHAEDSSCTTERDCPAGRVCVDGRCVDADAGTDGDGAADGADDGDADAAGDPGTPDAPDADAGDACGDGGCGPDCRAADAEPCEGTDRCDWETGECVPEDTPCALFGSAEECPDPAGGDPWWCGPGTTCMPGGGCTGWPPCSRRACSDDRICWGEDCPCTRPAASCSPPTLEDLNRFEFTVSAMDLEFDDACHAYVVTMISGTDVLREMEPDGTMNVWRGVSNLNMGEVAVLRRQGGEFGGTLGEVALTYICCPVCACGATPPQGVAHLDRTDGSLPHVIEATTTTGSGPFGDPILDAGPYGLTWGRDRNLYVGNVNANGDVHRVDLDAATTGLLAATIGSRVHAAAPYDLVRLLVAGQDGVIRLLHTRTGEIEVWTDAGDQVTSIVRDPFTGRVYVALTGTSVVEYDGDGTLRGTFETPAIHGRICLSPDGGLYHIEVKGADTGWAVVSRWELPATR